MTASLVALNNNFRPSKESRPTATPADIAELRRPLAIGLALSGLIALAVFVWGSVAALSGAVIAHGIVVVEGNSKKIQHQQGGVIGQILVRDGSRVFSCETASRQQSEGPPNHGIGPLRR